MTEAAKRLKDFCPLWLTPSGRVSPSSSSSQWVGILCGHIQGGMLRVEARPPSPPEPEPEPKPAKVEAPVAEPPDLLDLNDPVPGASELDEKNALALAIVHVGKLSLKPNDVQHFSIAQDLRFHRSLKSNLINLSGSAMSTDQYTPTSYCPNPANGTTGWELIFVTAPSSNESATTESKLAGGLDKLTLDSLYDDAMWRSNQNVSYNPWEPVPTSGPTMPQITYDPFFASNTVAAPPSVQMAAVANQQQPFMFQQQQTMMMVSQQQHPVNPFLNRYTVSIPTSVCLSNPTIHTWGLFRLCLDLRFLK
ncbi:ENTH/ANTH/VHS superfamily protein [Actinidia rufa]|uniref:ENTH/ANTH/VHS superfamily protein n=1 Tax=Actinidia rufa TaxID=165716 RepID=A0A7J0FP52_9ERIC|nr:ENTH/ANTH/VHS superfamily protein [Actinidia rufa]